MTVVNLFPINDNTKLQIIVDFARLQHTWDCLSRFHGSLLLTLCLSFQFFLVDIFRRELLQLDEKISQVNLECCQVHLDIECPVHELRYLRLCEVREAGDQQVAKIVSKVRWIRLSCRLRCGIKQRNGDLIGLDQMKHETKQGSMHFEARLVQTIGHDGKDILNKSQEVLLVECLRHVGRVSNILQEFVQNLQSL